MVFYLVRDASRWLSSIVFKSKGDAIISQKWRIDDPINDSNDDFPLSILEVDTNIKRLNVISYVTKAELRSYVEKNDSQKKGGSK